MIAYELKWRLKAADNISKWGLQDRSTLERAMMEELGEMVRASLQYDHEKGKWDRIEEELDDLAALVIQYRVALDNEVRRSP